MKFNSWSLTFYIFHELHCCVALCAIKKLEGTSEWCTRLSSTLIRVGTEQKICNHFELMIYVFSTAVSCEYRKSCNRAIVCVSCDLIQWLVLPNEQLIKSDIKFITGAQLEKAQVCKIKLDLSETCPAVLMTLWRQQRSHDRSHLTMQRVLMDGVWTACF